MKKFNLFFSVIIFFAAATRAQIVIDSVTTDTIDILNFRKISDQNRNTVPLWSTLFIPGPGHQSIGRSNSAMAYISADIISFFCAIFFNRCSVKTIKNSKAYASLHAGAASSVDDDLFWQAVGGFDTQSDYLQTLDLMRESDRRFEEERYRWVWEDKAYREEFQSMQKKGKMFGTVSSFFIGALILNRVVAFIDLRSTLKNNRYIQKTALHISPVLLKGTSMGGAISADF